MCQSAREQHIPEEIDVVQEEDVFPEIAVEEVMLRDQQAGTRS